MNITKPSRRVVVAAAALAVAAAASGLALSAGGDEDPGLAASRSADPSARSTTESAGPVPTESELPTVPPGDPGTGTSVPEESATELPGDGHRAVPPGALLDAETVAAVVGGAWQSVPAPPDSCDTPRPGRTQAARSGGLSGSKGQLVETVAIHDGDGAVQAVNAMAKRLRGCGWTLEPEPPLGEDSALLTRSSAGGPLRLVVVAAEGMTVTVLGRGAVTADQDDWAAIIDVAIGTSCLAAPDGCH